MAKNKPYGDNMGEGAVKDRSQVLNPKNWSISRFELRTSRIRRKR